MKLKICGNNGYIDLDNPNVWYSNENSDVIEWLSEGNTPEPEFTEKELLVQSQAEFRAIRDKYLVKCDIAINKALDNGKDATELRVLRQALRDAPANGFVMPDVSLLGV